MMRAFNCFANYCSNVFILDEVFIILTVKVEDEVITGRGLLELESYLLILC